MSGREITFLEGFKRHLAAAVASTATVQQTSIII